MPRRGKRIRLAKGIYRDKSGIAATVSIGTGPAKRQREKRYPAGTPLRDMKAWQQDTAALLREDVGVAKRGTLKADAARYLKLAQYLKNWAGVRSEVRAWVALYGHLHRAQITPAHVREARVTWLAEGKAPKTVNDRVGRLRRLYRTLDATPQRPKPPTPCDPIDDLPVAEAPSVAPDAGLLVQVLRELEAGERKGTLRDAKTRARFLVLATTGKRPAEVMRTIPEDLSLETRVWRVRNAKGGRGPGIFINDDMLAAWHLFVEADAWGAFNTGSYARVLRTAGWPAGLRPYNLRHAVGQAMSAAGVDLADIQAHYGHRHISTTRRHYVPVLDSRLETASRKIDGRLARPAGTGDNPSPDSTSEQT
jgi:integrase